MQDYENMWDNLKQKKAWLGLDGFVDQIVKAVQTRRGPGDQFEAYASLKTFGQKIAGASGANLNLELSPVVKKMGGNGPLLAQTLAQLGMQVRYMGTLGDPIHPLFNDFAQRTQAISLGHYGETTAVEFQDGKLILGQTYPLEAISYERLMKAMEPQQWIDMYSEMDLISFQNWTMTFHMNTILEKILTHIWPKVAPKLDRICFFDLADPAKRSAEDVCALLNYLPQFQPQAQVYLALNRSEVQYIAYLLDLPCCTDAWHTPSFFAWLRDLKSRLRVAGLILHGCNGAVAACQQEIAFAPVWPIAKITCLTGSGDHFNGGFLCGYFMHLPLEKCLRLGHSVAARYIESGETPDLESMRSLFKADAQ